jgi:hypothetical protein
MGSSRTAFDRSLGRRARRPLVVKHAGDIAAVAVYLGLGLLRERRPGQAARLARALVIRRQIQKTFARPSNEQAGGRRRLVLAAVGVGLALAWRKHRARPANPPLDPPATLPHETIAG